MLPDRTLTPVSQAYVLAATLLSFSVVGMSLIETPKRVGPNRLHWGLLLA
jgi:hypothetical protein